MLRAARRAAGTRRQGSPAEVGSRRDAARGNCDGIHVVLDEREASSMPRRRCWIIRMLANGWLRPSVESARLASCVCARVRAHLENIEARDYFTNRQLLLKICCFARFSVRLSVE